MEYLWVIGFFAAVFVIMLVVGTIGNKIVDGVNNAVRKQKKDEKLSEVRSLAGQMQGGVKKTPSARHARRCPYCGEAVPPGADFCPRCGICFSGNNH